VCYYFCLFTNISTTTTTTTTVAAGGGGGRRCRRSSSTTTTPMNPIKHQNASTHRHRQTPRNQSINQAEFF